MILTKPWDVVAHDDPIDLAHVDYWTLQPGSEIFDLEEIQGAEDPYRFSALVTVGHGEIFVRSEDRPE